MLGFAALWIAVAATGWLGRYEVPVVAGLGAAAVYAATTSQIFPAVDAIAVGCLLAYLVRASVVPKLRQGGDERGDVG